MEASSSFVLRCEFPFFSFLFPSLLLYSHSILTRVPLALSSQKNSSCSASNHIPPLAKQKFAVTAAVTILPTKVPSGAQQ